MNKAVKVTEFVGFMSGDFECFCLSRIPFKDWVKKPGCYPDPDLLYPDELFPVECNEDEGLEDRQLWEFKITVEAVRVNDKQ